MDSAVGDFLCDLDRRMLCAREHERILVKATFDASAKRRPTRRPRSDRPVGADTGGVASWELLNTYQPPRRCSNT